VEARPISYYAHLVRGALGDAAFLPRPTRLGWLALHVAVVIAGTAAIARGVGGWPGALALALVIGHSFAGMAFVGHETMHGAVVRAPRLRYAVGWLCFLPFTMAPRIWVAWHNRIHHGHTMETGVDPDAYPTLANWRTNRLTRVADYLGFARRRWAWWLTPLIGFSGQSQQILWRWSRGGGYLSAAERRLAKIETFAGLAVWLGLGALLGPRVFLCAYFLPLLVGNAIVISYILTNHSLSPLTQVNDPLLNSLSVTLPRPLEVLHLNFGYHVEHHLFPAMSPAFAPAVRDELQRRWPNRYQTLPMFTALARILATPRCYKDDVTLIDPIYGGEAGVLMPRPEDEPIVAPPLREAV
jgi:fatty acid desaturase